MNPDPQLTQESIRAVEAHAPAAPPPEDLDAPELYVNRELSWVDFDDRVMQPPEDPAQPLLERCKFAAIFESNLDEFFMIRVAGLHDQATAASPRPSPTAARPGRRRHHRAQARRPHAVGDDRRGPRQGAQAQGAPVPRAVARPAPGP